MSVATVAKKDLTSIRRSRALWAAVTVLALGVALFAYVHDGYRLSATESVTRLFRTLAFGLGLIIPLAALAASYLSITGERQSGGIKFLLSVPNTRRDIFIGKLASRVVFVSAAIGFVFLTAASIAVARHGTLPLRPVVGLFAITLVYATVFVNIAVALSAAVASRSRGIAASIGSYFVLVILYAIPNIRITAIVRGIHQTLLGFKSNPNLYDAITYTSPYVAFQKATNLVFPPSEHQRVFYRPDEAGELPVYLSDEFSLVVFAVWLVIPLVVGFLRFNATDLK